MRDCLIEKSLIAETSTVSNCEDPSQGVHRYDALHFCTALGLLERWPDAIPLHNNLSNMQL